MEQIDLATFLTIAEQVLDLPAEQVEAVTDIATAESALAAPFASFSGVDFYPEPYEQAAILCSRIVRNHPLPDGNKRAGWLSLRLFLALNGLPFRRPDARHVDITIRALAGRTMTESQFIDWVREHRA